MNYLTLIKTVLAAVRAVELLMPASPSKDKLDACLGIVSGVIGEVGGILPQLTNIVSVVVTGLHDAGVFSKKVA